MPGLSHSIAFMFNAIPPYDFWLTVRKPAGWSFLTPFEVFENNRLWTCMRADSDLMVGLRLTSKGTVENPRVSCKVFSKQELSPAERNEFKEALTWSLGLQEDTRGFYVLASRDSLIRALSEDLYGMRITKRCDVFPRLILAVTLQMAPIKRSDQMMNLLIQEYGEKVVFDGREVWYWPSPETIAKTRVEDLEKRCKLGYRAKALKSIAESVCSGFPTLQELERMSAEKAKTELMKLKGIGEYSADIVSPHPGFAVDVWSAKIFHWLLFGKDLESPRDIIPKLKEIAVKRWGEWRSYAFVYVLNDLEKLSKRFGFDLTSL